MVACNICSKEFKNKHAVSGHKRFHGEKYRLEKEKRDQAYRQRQVNKFNGFLDNKYTKSYYKLIERAQRTNYTCYTEKHHIVPRSLNGTNKKINLVILSAREHFICHILLCKMVEQDSYAWQKMVHAIMAMKAANIDQKRYVNARLYERYKEIYARLISEKQTGIKNSQFGTIWIHSINDGVAKKIRSIDPIPEGWLRGRVDQKAKIRIRKEPKEPKEPKERKARQQKQCLQERQERRAIEKQKTELLYEQFVAQNLSLRKFTRLYYDKSHVTLYNRFKKFIVR